LHLKACAGPRWISARADLLTGAARAAPGDLPDDFRGASGSGWRSRARLALYPPILLADEPTGNWTPTHGAEILALIRDLHER